MFRKHSKSSLEALALEPHISGVVILNDEVHHIRVLSELLFLDARAWFLSVEDSLLLESHAYDDAGDPDSAARFRDIALQIATMAESGKAVPSYGGTGIWPHLANRSQLSTWCVDNCNDVLRYTHGLLEFAESRADDPCVVDFLLMLSTVDDTESAAHFFHSPRLAHHARFSGAFTSTHKLSSKLLNSLCNKLQRRPEGIHELSKCPPDRVASWASR